MLWATFLLGFDSSISLACDCCVFVVLWITSDCYSSQLVEALWLLCWIFLLAYHRLVSSDFSGYIFFIFPNDFSLQTYNHDYLCSIPSQFILKDVFDLSLLPDVTSLAVWLASLLICELLSTVIGYWVFKNKWASTSKPIDGFQSSLPCFCYYEAIYFLRVDSVDFGCIVFICSLRGNIYVL